MCAADALSHKCLNRLYLFYINSNVTVLHINRALEIEFLMRLINQIHHRMPAQKQQQQRNLKKDNYCVT